MSDTGRSALFKMIKRDANFPRKNDGKDYFSNEQLRHLSLLIKKVIELEKRLEDQEDLQLILGLK